MALVLDKNQKNPVQVIVEDIKNNPQCEHGPTLLFIRGKKQFYACSAHRNRKSCSFYMSQEDWSRKKKANKFERPKIDRDDLTKNFQQVKFENETNRGYCHTCSVLYAVSKSDLHNNHKVQIGIKDDLLIQPTKIIRPLEDNKTEAQYFFSNESVITIVDILSQNKFKSALCLGAPRIHEYIKLHPELKIQTLLLDIDSRYYAFDESNEFCQFNLFNNHYFHKHDVDIVDRFIESRGKVCVVIDPPFGGRIEPIAQTIKEISSKRKGANQLPIILIMPYFMEPPLKQYIESIQMADYQVTYENHSSFQNVKDKKGSPVRIFTNIPLKDVSLKSDDYKYCEPCSKWVGKWNRHCEICDSCDSKNGETYVHCDKCKKCVKPTWEHCARCDRCKLKDHTDCEDTYFKHPNKNKRKNRKQRLDKAKLQKN